LLEDFLCPRCLGYIPSNAFAGEYPGAISRLDNKTEICSDCGVEEALLALIPISHWPIVMYHDSVSQHASDRWLTRLKMKELSQNET